MFTHMDEPCTYCGTFHSFGKSHLCPSMDDDQPFCEQHPDVPPKMVRGVEGDDIGYVCVPCEANKRCVYHPDTLYEDLGRVHNGKVMKECPECIKDKSRGIGLSLSEQASRYDDYIRGL
jgi:hypothetical protein